MSYSNRVTQPSKGVNGASWFIRERPHLAYKNAIDGNRNHADIAVIREINFAKWFSYDPTSDSYSGKFSNQQTLVHDPVKKEFVVTDLQGRKTTFYDFDASHYPHLHGQFKSWTDPDGRTSDAMYDSRGRMTRFEQEDGQGGTGSYNYTYYYEGGPSSSSSTGSSSSGSSSASYEIAGKLKDVTYLVNGTNVRRLSFEYYESTNVHGGSADLKRMTLWEWDGTDWQVLKHSLMRYYLGDEAQGFAHGLKYYLGPEGYRRMEADDKDPLTASDAEIAAYAENYYEYDSQKRVTKESVCGGVQNFEFAFAESGNTDGYNSWKVKTVETRSDGAEKIVFTNYSGKIMLKVLRAQSGEWYNFNRYDENGRVVLSASSMAVSGYDEQFADLLNYSGGTYQYLHDNQGLITVYEYFSTGPVGYLKSVTVKNGQLGTEIKQSEKTYTARSAGGSTIYVPHQETEFQSEANSGSDPATTEYTYEWYPGTLQMKQRKTTLPMIPTSQHGSGVANSREEAFDSFGRTTWEKNERGFLTHQIYDTVTGALVQTIEDVDTSIVSGAPTGWTTPPGGGLNLVTDYESNNKGRITQILGPAHEVDLNGVATSIRRATWYVYQERERQDWNAEGYATEGASGYQYNLINPVRIRKYDDSGRTVDEIDAVRADTSGRLEPTDSFPQSSWVHWNTKAYDDSGRHVSSNKYHQIPATGHGTQELDFYQTSFGYDSMGRQNRHVDFGGTITRKVYNVGGAVAEKWVGTDDSGATDSNPAGTGSPNNMVKVSAKEYDHGLSGGNGNLTKLTAYVNDSSTRDTRYSYDFRNRQITSDQPESVYETFGYDNLSRLLQRDQYQGQNGNLVARTDLKYDNVGRTYVSLTYAVTAGVPGNTLTMKRWWDASGNLIKRQNPGSRAFMKTQYDSLDRSEKEFVCFDASESDNDYPAAGSVAGNTVMQQEVKLYDAASNQLQVAKYERFHDSTGAGELNGPAGPQPKARIGYWADYPDVVGRPQANVDFGTNGGVAFSRPATVPARSAIELVTSVVYNSAGLASQTVNPIGREDRTEYDALGRESKTIENWVPAASGPDENKTTEFGYTGDDMLATVTAKNAVTGDQVTVHTYGTTLADSDIASNNLLRIKEFPGGGNDRIEFNYNRQGEVVMQTDQRGTVRQFDFDGLGRQTEDRVTALGADVDGEVRRISQSYAPNGLIGSLTSHSDPTVGSGVVVNEIEIEYDGFNQTAAVYQSHSGSVNKVATPKVQYGHADGTNNTARRTSLTYPNGTMLDYHYGGADSEDDMLSRVKSCKLGLTTIVEYSRLGSGRTVIANYKDQPDVELSYFAAGASGDAGDPYTGLDRFGRVVDQRWKKGSSDVDRVQYGFDEASNRKWLHNVVAVTGRDAYYERDGLSQLKNLQRGTLNGGKSGIDGTPAWEEDFNFDPSGNWHGNDSAYQTKVSGNTTLDQSRTHNLGNEITDISTSTGTNWFTPEHDAAGNMSRIPQPEDLASSYHLVWDAWNRLVEVRDGTTAIGVYRYDGHGRRLTKEVGGATRHYYYSTQWQVLEERVDAAVEPECQYVWGQRYRDDLMLRDRDSNGDGNMDERLYVTHDYFSVTAVLDTSGNVKERYGYDAYGRTTYLDPDFTAKASSAFDWIYLYAAYQIDGNTGLYQVRNRYLHSDLGRWLSRDPAGEQDNLNLYAYVGNGPVDKIDALGLWATAVHDRVVDNWMAFHERRDGVSYSKYKWHCCEIDVGAQIKQGSKDADGPIGQMSVNSFWHGMRNGAEGASGQTVASAQAKWTDFIRENVENARLFAEAAWTALPDEDTACQHVKDGLYTLGWAFHAVSDAKSPAHTGFQKWWGLYDGIRAMGAEAYADFVLDHASKETMVVFRGMERAIHFDIVSRFADDVDYILIP